MTEAGGPYTLARAAAAGQVVEVRCTRCNRVARFLASDLAELLYPDRDSLLPPFPCGGCKRADCIRVGLMTPAPGDAGSLPVRRPAKLIHYWTSKTVMLGEPGVVSAKPVATSFKLRDYPEWGYHVVTSEPATNVPREYLALANNILAARGAYFGVMHDRPKEIVLLVNGARIILDSRVDRKP